MTKEKFTKYIAGLCKAGLKNSVKLDGESMNVWFNALSDLTDQELIKAINAIVRQEEWFPTIALIRKYAKPDRLSVKQMAELAWVDADSAVETHGIYASVKFEDNIINSVINAMGGWIWFCRECEGSDFDRRHFIDLYEIFFTRENYPKQLTGIHGRVNGAGCYLPTIQKKNLLKACGIELCLVECKYKDGLPQTINRNENKLKHDNIERVNGFVNNVLEGKKST